MKKGTNTRAYDLESVSGIFVSGKALKVEHPDGPPSWFYRKGGRGDYLYYRTTSGLHRSTVDEDSVLSIANHPENEWVTVPVSDSPFG